MKLIIPLLGLFVIGIAAALFSISTEETKIRVEAKYHRGQIVHMVVDDRPAQVIEIFTFAREGCPTYNVRVSANTSTAPLIGKINNSPYTIEYVKQFELKD